jgi:NADH-quinone oxidoreductase subunit E
LEAAQDAAGVEHGEETSPDGAITVHEEECLGACDAAPLVQIDFANHDRVTPERVVELVAALRAGEIPTPSRGRAPKDFREASRILAGGWGGSGSEHVSPPRAGVEEAT